MHAAAAVSVAAADVPLWLLPIGVGALAVHAFARRPVSWCGIVVCRADSRFDLPGLGRTGLALSKGAVAARRWVSLVLEDQDTTVHIMLIRDQLDDASWRRLLARLAAARA